VTAMRSRIWNWNGVIALRAAESCRVLVYCGVAAVLGGCANEELVKKSQGYYQEGVASLSTDRQRAFVSFQKSVQLDPDNKQARYALGHVYAMQGKLSKAEEEFRAAVRIDEDFSEAHTYLGQILFSQNRLDEAIQSYRQALTNPLYATPDLARFHLGKALAQQGNLQGSMEALEDAVVVSPPSVPPAMIHLELGRVYVKLGFTARAREVLEKAVALDQGGEYSAAAKELLVRLK